MSGFLALGVVAYILVKSNRALEADDDKAALGWLLFGFFVVFVLGSIFL